MQVVHTGYTSTPTIELTWGLILASARNLIAENTSLRGGGWQQSVGDDMAGRTLGVVGLGNVGGAVAQIGNAFGMKVIAWSQNLTTERAAEVGAALVTKDELFQEADIVSIHLVLSDRTRGLVGAAELALMKPTARLINTSRGPIVVEADLVAALKDKKIAGAAIDVFDQEPLPLDHPLRSLPNLLATPHIGYVSRGLYERFYQDTVANIRRWLESQAAGLTRAAALGATIMTKLQGKVAVVTGGASGIGFAIAKRFVDEGAFVFITGRRQKELDEAVKAIGGNVVGVQGDVSKLQDLDRLYETVKAKGKIDVLVANAGVGEFAPLASLTEEHFDKLFDLNVKGTLFTVQKALTLLNDGGSIILIGSVASVKGTPAFGAYGATKAAVRNLVRAWTVELKDRRIRSNVLSPGPIKTPLVDRQPPEAIARILATIPMGRMGEPDEVAKAAVFLASDDSSFVTGIELFVDGGRGQV